MKAPTFKQSFNKYVYAGEFITTEHDGFIIKATLHYDDCVDKPDERDDGFWPSLDPKAAGYIGSDDKVEFERQQTKAQAVMDAWDKNEWFYGGIVLTVSKLVEIPGRLTEEVIISHYAASLWGVACNYPGTDNDYLNEVANDLLPEALDHAKAVLAKLAA